MPFSVWPQEQGFFDLQEALRAISIRQETLKEQLALAKSKGEEAVVRSIQVPELLRTPGEGRPFICLSPCSGASAQLYCSVVRLGGRQGRVTVPCASPI